MEKIFNTGETPSELKAKYNPEGSILRKVQLRMLDMLIFLDETCKKLDIEYMLGGGNLLGALRHGGFIPWDDDIDVLMHPKDMKILRQYFISNPHPQYVLQNHHTDKGYFQSRWDVLRDTKSEYIQDSIIHNMRKFRGVQIDIFGYEPYGCIAISKFSAKLERFFISKLYGKCNFLLRLNFFLLDKIIFPALRLLLPIFGKKDIYVHSLGYGEVFPIKKDILYPFKPIVFEGHTFMGPAQPDKLLKIFYKNYMNLPPADKRDHHEAQYKIWD